MGEFWHAFVAVRFALIRQLSIAPVRFAQFRLQGASVRYENLRFGPPTLSFLAAIIGRPVRVVMSAHLEPNDGLRRSCYVQLMSSGGDRVAGGPWRSVESERYYGAPELCSHVGWGDATSGSFRWFGRLGSDQPFQTAADCRKLCSSPTATRPEVVAVTLSIRS